MRRTVLTGLAAWAASHIILFVQTVLDQRQIVGNQEASVGTETRRSGSVWVTPLGPCPSLDFCSLLHFHLHRCLPLYSQNTVFLRLAQNSGWRDQTIHLLKTDLLLVYKEFTR